MLQVYGAPCTVRPVIRVDTLGGIELLDDHAVVASGARRRTVAGRDRLALVDSAATRRTVEGGYRGLIRGGSRQVDAVVAGELGMELVVQVFLFHAGQDVIEEAQSILETVG